MVAIGVFTEIFSGIIVFAGVSHIADFHHIPIQNMTAQGNSHLTVVTVILLYPLNFDI